jgi:DNA helicase-2/ATP-dependent DNA helicase PcrA
MEIARVSGSLLDGNQQLGAMLLLVGAVTWLWVGRRRFRRRNIAGMEEFGGYQSIGLENELLQANLSYTVSGFDSYLFRPEILLVRGLLAYAADDFSAVRSADTRARILRSMLLFGRAKIDTANDTESSQSQLEKEAIQAVSENDRIIIPFFENQILRTAAPDAALRMRNAVEAAKSSKGADGLRTIIEALDPQHLASHALVEAARIQQVMGNIRGLLASASTHASLGDFFATLNEFEVRQNNLKTKESIVLSSVEASKGLEFDHVVLPNMSQREFAIAGNSSDDRNLFYVAITRAKNKLSIYFNPSKPSKYLVDAGLLDKTPMDT